MPGVSPPGFVGLAATFSVVGAWIGLLLAGWFLIFSAIPHSIVNASSGSPADVSARLYFAAYSLLTLGNGDFVPSTDTAQTLTWLATLSGLFLITFTITYLIPLRSAVSQKRALARTISSIGENPTAILLNAWQGGNFDRLEQYLFATSSTLSLLAEQHLAYPVLHLFHSRSRMAAVGPALAMLDEAILLLSEVVAPECRPSAVAVKPAREAIDAFLATLPDPYAQSESDAPPPTSVQPLEDEGIPVVDREEIEATFERHQDRRRRLRAVVDTKAGNGQIQDGKILTAR